MAGITHAPFRRLMRKHGSAIVISELLSAHAMIHGGRRNTELMHFTEEERPIGLQIFGEEGAILARAASIVQAAGADFVDVNLGCPVPKVVKKGAGAALCRDPEKLYACLKAIRQAIDIPLTIKIRLGWDAQSQNAREVLEVAHAAGVAWVAIHARTRAQGYSGEADWEALRSLKLSSPLPIIGNGDIQTADQAIQKLKSSHVDAVMIGRAALRNPFIFEEILARRHNPQVEGTQKTSASILELFDEFKMYLEDGFSPSFANLHARKFLAWFASGFRGCHAFRKEIFELKETNAVWDLARSFFGSFGERDMAFLQEPFLMGGHG